MGLAYNVYLNSNRIYGCKNCKTHLSNHDDILSRVSEFFFLVDVPLPGLRYVHLGVLLPRNLIECCC